MSEIRYEARMQGTVLQIRGDKPGNKWRNAVTPEDLENAQAVLEAGGSMTVSPPDARGIEEVRRGLEMAARPSPAVLAAASRAGELLGTATNAPSVARGEAEAAPAVATAGPAAFILDGRPVPLSQRTQDALLELARAICEDAEAVDRDANAKTAWKGARIYPGDLLRDRDVLNITFGNPMHFRDGLPAFAIVTR